MVVVSVSSGLGNQLFQYATARRLAAKRSVPLKLDLAWFRGPQDIPGLNMFKRSYRLHEFKIDADVVTPAELKRFVIPPLRRFDLRRIRGPWWRFLRCHLPSYCRGMSILERDPNFDPSILHLPGDVYLKGWWQSDKYFRDFAGVIRAELALRDTSLVERATSYVNTRRNGHRPLVAVQVRRGDVARAHEVLKDLTHMPYELISREYLRAAMSIFGDDATFLVFSETSEDIAWCRANLYARDIHFVDEGHGDLHDFAAMSHCDHNIISNSSYGWWAAWSNPNPAKTVVAPQRWFRPQYAPKHDIHGLVPSSWIIR